MARPRKKPGFDPDKEMEELIDRIASEYGTYDDRGSGGETGCYGKPVHTPSLNEVARRFGLNVTKTRKLLITAGVYSTETSRTVQSMHDGGASLQEIMAGTGLCRAAVNSYLPYERVVYHLDEASPNADRIRIWRGRKQAVDELAGEMKKADAAQKDVYSNYKVWHGNAGERRRKVLWNAIELFEGYWFELDGVKFRYTVDAEGLYFAGWDMAVKRKTVELAFESVTSGPGGRDDCPACLCPVFERFGVLSGERA